MPTARTKSKALPRADFPEQVGVSSKAISELLDDFERSQIELHSIMILRHRKVAFETWRDPYAPDIPHTMYSVSKSFTSIAIGFAIDEGLLTLDTKVIDIFPEYRPQKYDENLEKLTVFHLLTMTAGKSERRKNVGTILAGFAILMFGMEAMSGAVAPLESDPAFTGVFTMFSNPILGVLVGMILTAIIQSSSASVGILQALSATGAISVGAAFPIILGQNIGTCITALISSIGTNKNAKRTAVIHLTFNIIGVVCGMALFYGANAIFHFAFLDKAVNGADIAAIHTAFNVFCTVLLFPFGKQLEKLSCLIVRDKADKTQPAAADNDALVEERFLMSPSFAIEKCRERTNDMARLAQKNTLLSLGFIRVYNKKDSEAIHQNEKALDAFEDELETYLVKISSMQLSLENSMQVSKLSHAIGNFERIGDYAVNILKTKRTMHEDKIHFSKEASKELEVMSSAVQEIITKATNAFIENDVAAAQTIEPLEQVIDNLKAELRARHTKRLQAGECTIETGMLFFDIINSFERIADHCSNLAVCIIELSQGSYQTHRYLKSVKSQENARFMKSFEDYLRKYALH